MSTIAARLWDAEQAGRWVLTAIAGLDAPTYLVAETTRFAVERQLTVVGEALAAVRRLSPELAARIPALTGIIGFRNILVHGYAQIDDAQVWAIVSLRLPALVEQLAALRAEIDASSTQG